MKILLLGEFSALHKNIKEGLVSLGHDVTIVSTGDGWKKIESDINLGSNKKGILAIADKLWKLVSLPRKLKDYDVVQLVSPVIFPIQFGINKALIKQIIKNNKKTFLVIAGCNDFATADFFENSYKYPQFYKEIKKSLNGFVWCQSEAGRMYNQWLFRNVDGVIPIMYEYAQGFRDIGYKKLLPTTPIAINIDEIEYKDNVVGDKVVFFHGLNREGVKGTALIVEALNNLKKKYPKEIEIIIEGQMPLTEYLKILAKSNVVIDQVYSCSNGVNAIYSLAMGKVVVGGGELESLHEFNIESSPLITIQDNVCDIESQLEKLIQNKEEILNIGEKSRAYVEELHNYKNVAKQYVDIWSEG